MPQVQNAIPVAEAPFKKFLRVVIQPLHYWYRQRFLRPANVPTVCSSFLLGGHIAKREAEEQSFLRG
jgi:hypothetical protein